MPSLDFKSPRRPDEGQDTFVIGPKKRILLAGLIVLSGVYWLTLGVEDLPVADQTTKLPVEIDEPAHVPLLPLPANHESISGTISRGEVFSEALKRTGIPHEQVFILVKALRKSIPRADFNPNIVQRGDRFSAKIDSANVIQEFEYLKRGALDSRIIAMYENTGLRAWKENIPLEKRVVVVSEKLNDSIWNALRATGKNPDVLSHRLSDIFEYEIDFMVDCRPGDRFSLAFVEFYKDDEFVRYGEILAAEYASDREHFQAYLYERENGDRSYHDEEGKSLRGIFLKSPLNYRRISSGYSNRRFHPVLKKYVKHHGIDYAANYGTAVWATAEGTVSFIGRKGPLGNYIEIKHTNGYKTGYGHLSKFRKELKKGSRVNQKQTIGYVGATGRATGPHLHYNFYTRSKGKYKLTNPSRVINRPTGKAVPKDLIADFYEKRDALSALFDHQSGSIVTAYLDGTESRNAE